MVVGGVQAARCWHVAISIVTDWCLPLGVTPDVFKVTGSQSETMPSCKQNFSTTRNPVAIIKAWITAGWQISVRHTENTQYGQGKKQHRCVWENLHIVLYICKKICRLAFVIIQTLWGSVVVFFLFPVSGWLVMCIRSCHLLFNCVPLIWFSQQINWSPTECSYGAAGDTVRSQRGHWDGLRG